MFWDMLLLWHQMELTCHNERNQKFIVALLSQKLKRWRAKEMWARKNGPWNLPKPKQNMPYYTERIDRSFQQSDTEINGPQSCASFEINLASEPRYGRKLYLCKSAYRSKSSYCQKSDSLDRRSSSEPVYIV